MTSEVDREGLTALLTRLEAATGPDRILGIDLLAALRPKKYRRGVTNGGEHDGEVYLIKYKKGNKWTDKGWYGVKDEDPTASLDTAVALVERLDLQWSKSFGDSSGHQGYICVSDPEACVTVRPKSATLPMTLSAGVVMVLLARLDTQSPK